MADTYRVGGMTCGGCARSVTNAIGKLAPGAAVTVDLDAGTVAVEGGVAPETVRKAVEGAGFDFGGPAG
ncbi:copper chaperone [Azospirillum brasilense]|nr:copper chaperone [Azospirillum brasilense]